MFAASDHSINVLQRIIFGTRIPEGDVAEFDDETGRQVRILIAFLDIGVSFYVTDVFSGISAELLKIEDLLHDGVQGGDDHGHGGR